MERLNVLVIMPAFAGSTPHVDEDIMRRIKNVSPKIRVTDGSAEAYGDSRGDDKARKELDVLLADADIIFGLFLTQPLVQKCGVLQNFAEIT